MLLLLACTAPPSTEPSQDDTADVPRTSIIPGPAQGGHDAALAASVEAHDRVNAAISSAPYGMSLDAYLADRTALDAWAETGTGYTTADFEAQSGTTLAEQVYAWDEMGDLGMFGGVAAVGTAYKYALLREDPGASPESVDDARAAFVRLLGSLHAMQAITGTPGVLVRGLVRYHMAGLESPDLTPLADDEGNPLPTDKEAVFRADVSGDYPDWYWIDDTSKDQFTGYVAALGAAWEVAAGDPDLDPALVDALVDDATALGHALAVPSPVTGLDLSLMDADGRPTTFHDLNARELEDHYTDDPWNASNALLALGGLRVLATVSGDPEVEALYEDVAIDRGYAELVEDVATYTYFGKLTNYSDVNMNFTAGFSWCHFETDPELLSACRVAVSSLWAPGTDRAAWEFADAWFTVIAAAYALPDAGVSQGDVDLALENLADFHPAPYWNDAVTNCDADEVAAGVCLAVDGVTRLTLAGTWDGDTFTAYGARNEDYYAVGLVPQSVRPPSNFEWRSDPYRVNGGGGDRLNPAGELHGAYWLGRWLAPGDGVAEGSEGRR